MVIVGRSGSNSMDICTEGSNTDVVVLVVVVSRGSSSS